MIVASGLFDFHKMILTVCKTSFHKLNLKNYLQKLQKL